MKRLFAPPLAIFSPDDFTFIYRKKMSFSNEKVFSLLQNLFVCTANIIFDNVIPIMKMMNSYTDRLSFNADKK